MIYHKFIGPVHSRLPVVHRLSRRADLRSFRTAFGPPELAAPGDYAAGPSSRTTAIDKRTRRPGESGISTHNMDAKLADNPALGQVRVSNELRKKGILVSPGGVRSIWLRHDMETFQKRLKALSTKVEQEGIVLDENQVAALEKAKAEKQAHGEIETYYPGFLVAQDTYYVGYIKGVGHIYQQTVIDTYSKIGFAKLYDRKNALVAADMLNDRVVPFFEQHDLKLMRMLTDRGTEYCGNRETHEYELYLAIEDIDHSKIKAKSPQTNGICERFNRTVQNEFYAIAFRKKIYTSIEQLQADLDTWMNSYNTQRTHSGKYCFGKTPMQTFLEGMEVARRYQLQDAGKIQPDEQVIGSPGCESENSCVSSQMASDTFFVR